MKGFKTVILVVFAIQEYLSQKGNNDYDIKPTLNREYESNQATNNQGQLLEPAGKDRCFEINSDDLTFQNNVKEKLSSYGINLHFNEDVLNALKISGWDRVKIGQNLNKDGYKFTTVKAYFTGISDSDCKEYSSTVDYIVKSWSEQFNKQEYNNEDFAVGKQNENWYLYVAKRNLGFQSIHNKPATNIESEANNKTAANYDSQNNNKPSNNYDSQNIKPATNIESEANNKPATYYGSQDNNEPEKNYGPEINGRPATNHQTEDNSSSIGNRNCQVTSESPTSFDVNKVLDLINNKRNEKGSIYLEIDTNLKRIHNNPNSPNPNFYRKVGKITKSASSYDSNFSQVFCDGIPKSFFSVLDAWSKQSGDLMDSRFTHLDIERNGNLWGIILASKESF